MFSWFLKLLGIDEDRPTASQNSYLDSSAKSNTTQTKISEPEKKSKPSPEPEIKPDSKPETSPKKSKPKAEPVKKPEPKAKAKVETKSEKKPAKQVEKKSDTKSLSDDFPTLKANYIKVLEEAGFTTKADIDKASDKDLLALKGIGKATLKIMRG